MIPSLAMPAVLRIYGRDFDVGAAMAACTLEPCAVKRRGERLWPGSKTNLKAHEQRGLHFVASDADFNDLPKQVSETTDFLRIHFRAIDTLVHSLGVEDACLDFGVQQRDTFTQSDSFPAELIQIAGQLGLGIELSQYPIQNDAADEAAES